MSREIIYPKRRAEDKPPSRFTRISSFIGNALQMPGSVIENVSAVLTEIPPEAREHLPGRVALATLLTVESVEDKAQEILDSLNNAKIKGHDFIDDHTALTVTLLKPDSPSQFSDPYEYEKLEAEANEIVYVAGEVGIDAVRDPRAISVNVSRHRRHAGVEAFHKIERSREFGISHTLQAHDATVLVLARPEESQRVFDVPPPLGSSERLATLSGFESNRFDNWQMLPTQREIPPAG